MHGEEALTYIINESVREIIIYNRVLCAVRASVLGGNYSPGCH